MKQTNRPIIFLGASLNVLTFLDTCNAAGITVSGIIDDNYYGNRADIDGIPIISGESVADFQHLKKDYDFFIAVNPTAGLKETVNKRNNYIKLCKDLNLPLANIIDPTARISTNVILGNGIYIGFCALVGGNSKINDHCQIQWGAGIGHHSIIGENVIVQRHALTSGSTTVEDNAYIGIGSKIIASTKEIHGMTIGKNAVIAPGLVVMRSVDPYEIVTHVSRKVYQSDTVIS